MNGTNTAPPPQQFPIETLNGDIPPVTHVFVTPSITFHSVRTLSLVTLIILKGRPASLVGSVRDF